MMLLPSSGWDLIVPGIAIGEAHSALDTEMLVANGFTHVLNTCACEEGDDESFHVCTGPDYYEGKLVYSGTYSTTTNPAAMSCACAPVRVCACAPVHVYVPMPVYAPAPASAYIVFLLALVRSLLTTYRVSRARSF